MASSNFRSLRILLLLAILLAVAGNEYLTRMRSTDWNDSLWLVIYPINADHSSQTQNYISKLSEPQFSSIEKFMAREAKRYGLETTRPITVKLAPAVQQQPPMPPDKGNLFAVMLWSLQLRYWAYRHADYDGPQDIKMFVRYFDPDNTRQVAHSLGLQKGMIGIVNAYASKQQRSQNHFVIAHEMLHTVGASDKYAPATNLPMYPIGYAEPDKNPLWPQRWAEIMGGRIPLSETQSVMPKGLKQARIGQETALEIRWLELN